MASVTEVPASGLREPSGNIVGVDRLPDEMNDMKIRDDKEMEATMVDGNGTETRHIIVTTIGGRNGQPKQTISYMAERVVGHGSFGVVFQIFHKRIPPEAVDLVSRLLQYSPNLRSSALEVLIHPFFNELPDPNIRLPNARFLPPLFNFKPHELKGVPMEMLERLIPEHAKKQSAFLGL